MKKFLIIVVLFILSAFSLLGGTAVSFAQSCKSPATGPGNDHPDETFSVSSVISAIKIPVPNISSLKKVASIRNGYFNYLLKPLLKLGWLVDYIDTDNVCKARIEPSNILIIPTGGFYGLENSAMLKASLENYVSRGGTILCFAQQHGYEFSVLPGGLSGYGWQEDASCVGSNSAYIDTYHPIFSSQTSGWLNANWDGYFTTYPDNATVLARRNKNAQASMLMYPYGKGYVIATTMYSDWGYAHSQTGTGELNIVRDILTWSQKGKVDGEYKSNDSVTLPIKIINATDTTVTQVTLRLLNPNKQMKGEYTYNVSLQPGDSTVINFSTIAELPLGIWSIEYSFDTFSFVSGALFSVANPTDLIVTDKSLTFTVNTTGDLVPIRSTAPFTLNIWNNGTTVRTIDIYYDVTHCYKTYWGQIVIQPGENIADTKFIDLSRGCISSNMYRLWVACYEGDKFLGNTSVSSRIFIPSVNVSAHMDKEYYVRGDSAQLTLSLQNKANAEYNSKVDIRVLDPLNRSVYYNTFPISLTPNINLNLDQNFGMGSSFALSGVYTGEAHPLIFQI